MDTRTPKAGDIRRFDFQSDVYSGRYELIRKLGPSEWEIKILPADEITEGLIVDHWAYAEAHGYSTCPIWDKTWAECAEGEAPQRIGYLTYEQELEGDLARVNERAGTISKIKFVSRDEWAKYF